MKTFRNISILLVALAFSFGANSISNDIPENIVSAIKSGNAKELAVYFNSSIELTLLSKEDIYSKEQAELILKNFFQTHVPNSFTLLHEGGKESSKYAIGKLKTSKGNFRVTILLKSQNNKLYIHQLRIEGDNVE
ncbi:MAG: DUF4783 domain-containing protein [Bacteroidales bacterium]|nr:DUF4783 domain-containing protein [Bacteroidales bacterium]